MLLLHLVKFLKKIILYLWSLRHTSFKLIVEAETLCLFHVLAPTLAPLVYEADHSTQVRLRDYVVSHVFTDLEEDEPEEEDGD